MTATTPPPPWAAPPRRWGAGRITALVIGVVLLVPGIGMLAGGGALLWADRSLRTSDGFVLSASDRFTAPGYALSSDTLDLSTGASWLPVSSALGDARVQVTATDGRDVFVGVAPAERARAYLRGVGHTVVADIGAGATRADQTTVAGGAPATPPGDQDFWVARASGPGTQRLTWQPADGAWTLVVMNADGSDGVSVRARAGATVPALGTLAWSVLGVGALVTAVGVLLIVLAARAGSGPAPTAGSTGPAGPPGSSAARLPSPREGSTDAPQPAWGTDPGAGRPPG